MSTSRLTRVGRSIASANGLPLAIVNDLYMPGDGSFLPAASYGRRIRDYTF